MNLASIRDSNSPLSKSLFVRSVFRGMVAWIIAAPLNPVFIAAWWFTTSSYRAASDLARIQLCFAAPFGAGLVVGLIIGRRGVDTSSVILWTLACSVLSLVAGCLLIGLPTDSFFIRIVVMLLWIPVGLWAAVAFRLIALRRNSAA